MLNEEHLSRTLEQKTERRRDGVVAAVADFLGGRSKQRKQRRENRQKTETPNLWEQNHARNDD